MWLHLPSKSKQFVTRIRILEGETTVQFHILFSSLYLSSARQWNKIQKKKNMKEKHTAVQHYFLYDNAKYTKWYKFSIKATFTANFSWQSRVGKLQKGGNLTFLYDKLPESLMLFSGLHAKSVSRCVCGFLFFHTSSANLPTQTLDKKLARIETCFNCCIICEHVCQLKKEKKLQVKKYFAFSRVQSQQLHTRVSYTSPNISFSIVRAKFVCF